ncbi:MAG: large conductance mechanosensitive channel protein MscL [Actinomycetota bacterium]
MKSMIEEFKDFINKGDVVTIAVGLILALYFQKIVDALLEGVVNPIIAAIFGESNFRDIGFDVGDARISIGLVIDAAISFVAVAFILFLLIKAYNKWKGDDEEDSGPSEVDLLTEIRDQLKAQN